jgi:hypothetical protein
VTVDTSGLTKVYLDDMVNAAASSGTSPNYFGSPDWTLSFGDFIGCIDEVRISNVIRN